VRDCERHEGFAKSHIVSQQSATVLRKGMFQAQNGVALVRHQVNAPGQVRGSAGFTHERYRRRGQNLLPANLLQRAFHVSSAATDW
jgi:hypothetical protein